MFSKLLMVSSACLILMIPADAVAQSQTSAITKESVADLYKGLVEAKISGGEYLVSYHDRHYHTDLDLIIIFSGQNDKRKFSKTFMDYNKNTFMQAIKQNSTQLNHKDGSYDVEEVSVGDTGRKAHVKVKLVSNFEVFSAEQGEMRFAEETMNCNDTLVLNDEDVLQIQSSQCDVFVNMK